MIQDEQNALKAILQSAFKILFILINPVNPVYFGCLLVCWPLLYGQMRQLLIERKARIHMLLC